MESSHHQSFRKNRDVYIIPRDAKFTETLIFMHGLGDTADGGWFSLFVDKNTSPCPPTTKVVLLQAPFAKVTINQGMKMPSWFDIKDLTASQDKFEDSVGIEEIRSNTERINTVIKEEIAELGGDSKRVMIAGFSQGCGMAFHAGLQFTEPLGGIIGWSGYLFPITQVHPTNERIPILIANGVDDPVIPFELANKSYERLDKKKHRLIQLKEEGLEHSINENILKATSTFIRQLYAKDSKL